MWQAIGGLLGRADGLVKIRGVLFSPRAVEDVVRTFAQTGEYRVIIECRDALDEVTLKMETEVPTESHPALMEDLVSALKLKTNLRFQVELCPPGTFPRQEIKTRRVEDKRT